MDVGNPSNWPRIMELYGNNFDKICDDIKGWAYSDDMTRKVIRQVYKKTEYILDPHSAIGYRGLHDTIISRNGEVNGVFLATAHPAKFLDVVGEIVPEEIPMPHNLRSVLKKKKNAISMPADYKEFRKFISDRK